MSIPVDGGSAFPVPYGQTNGADGMTLRDYFTAHAPPVPSQVMDRFFEVMEHADSEMWGPDRMTWNEGNLKAIAQQEARWRVAYADALLKALKKGPQ